MFTEKCERNGTPSSLFTCNVPQEVSTFPPRHGVRKHFGPISCNRFFLVHSGISSFSSSPSLHSSLRPSVSNSPPVSTNYSLLLFSSRRKSLMITTNSSCAMPPPLSSPLKAFRRCMRSFLEVPTDLTSPMLAVQHATNVPDVSFSVFCAENDKCQVQVPISSNSVDIAQTLTSVHHFRFLHRHDNCDPCSKCLSGSPPAHSHHLFEISQMRQEPPEER